MFNRCIENLFDGVRVVLRRSAPTITLAQMFILVTVCAVALSVWRTTGDVEIALWSLVSVVLVRRFEGHRTFVSHVAVVPRLATIAIVAGALLIAGGVEYVIRLPVAGRPDEDALFGLRWCLGYGDYSLFLIMLAVLAHSAVPQKCQLGKIRRYARHVLNAFLVVLALAMLLSMSVDVAAIPTLTDLAIENGRRDSGVATAPEGTEDANAFRRTASETRGFIVMTLVTNSLALVGLAGMMVADRPRRILGVALTIPGGIWLASICVGRAHRLSPFMFGAIAESADPLLVGMWIAACALAAFRLATRSVQSSQAGNGSSRLLDVAVLIAAAYTLYERRVLQGIVNGGISLSDVAGDPSALFVEIAALVMTLISLRNVVARQIGLQVIFPTNGKLGDVLILFCQLVLLGPLCVLAGSVYWIACMR